MSLPKLTPSPPLASSPSRQSIRRTSSRPQSIDQAAAANDPLDEHQSHHEAVGTIASRLAQGGEEAQYESQFTSHTLFQPFFTLIEDAHTSEYYHPTVHYIFSDDDTDIITEAALRSLEAEREIFPNAKGKSKQQGQRQPPPEGENGTYEDDGGTAKEPLLPDPVPGVRDNYIILDIDHLPSDRPHGDPTSGYESKGQTPQNSPPTKQQPDQHLHQLSASRQFTVTSTQSLSPSWQVLDTQLLPAPTFENNSSGETPTNGGLMLQIQGTAGLPVGMLGKDKERGSQRLEDMMDQFAKRLGELRQVIESGERGMSVEGGEALQNPELVDEASPQDPSIVPTGDPDPSYKADDVITAEQQQPGAEGFSHTR
ncbi:hypothetical protein ARAM_004275 [Aspergillus rambellii]|uniref:Anaphase promoting complex subunit 11 n=1 Tax=Aspergillus rambellii TaxID=308745 RepID=A0A0F8UIL2_9EURO|nr:hypothetical protein ARAM_004275 [Aspergillus rambellii]